MTTDTKSRTWMVRAGRGGYLIDEFLSKGLISIGWNKIGALTKKTTYEELKDKLAETYPDDAKGRINQSAGQIWRFFNEFSIDDNVITYDPETRSYYIGQIKSEYKFSDIYEHHHIRFVSWDSYPYDRDYLTLESKNILGSILTLFEVPPSVVEEFEYLSPMKPPSNEFLQRMDEESEEFTRQEEERIAKDIVGRSREFIKDIIVKLDWNEVEQVSSGILATMGYKTRLTSPGSDLGSDIIASPDGLGLVEPIIKVEVKHKVKSKEKVSAPDIRNFIGGLRHYTKGIYISTTGFSKEAQYEAERANFQITLIDFELFVDLLTENYEKLEPEIKALVPLKRIYWPIS